METKFTLFYKEQRNKTAFLIEIMQATGVSYATALRWAQGKNVPQNHLHIKVLSEITGISAEELFNN